MTSIDYVLNDLPRVCTKARVSEFLGQKGLTHSASNWNEMIEARIIPALESGTLTEEELLELYRSEQEYGGQHVLLFRVLDRDLLKDLFERNVAEDVFTGRRNMPRLNMFSTPKDSKPLELFEARFDWSGNYQTMVLKFSVLRKTMRFVEQRATPGGGFSRIFEPETYHALDVIRISEIGLCDVRLQSHKRSHDYAAEAEDLLDYVKRVIPRRALAELSLRSVKERVFDPDLHETLPGAFQLRHTKLTQPAGPTLHLAAGALDSGLLDYPHVAEGLAAFRAGQRVRTDDVGFWLELDDATADEHATVLKIELGGNLNEFALSPKVGRAEYETILGAIVGSSLDDPDIEDLIGHNLPGWTAHLDLMLSEAEAKGKPDAFDFQSFYDEINPPGARALAEALTERVLTGRLVLAWQILDPDTSEVIGEFDAFDDIPKEAEGSGGDVTPIDPINNVRPLYRPARAGLIS